MTRSARKSELPAVGPGEWIVDALSRVPLFEGLNRGELAPLAAMTVVRRYRGKVMVIGEGEAADTLYFVLSGRLRVFVTGTTGQEVVLHVQEPGSYFGDMMLDDGLRSASVSTIEPCVLGALSREVFRAFLVRHPDTALALIKSLIHRTRALNEQLRDFAMLDVCGRAAKLLRSMAREVDGQLVIEERLTQQEIGQRIGASREMVSRVLKDMKASGYLRTEGRRTILLERRAARR